jgi:hypothetical protein
MSIRLPEFLFDNISSTANAQHSALIEAAALIDQALYQEFNDPTGPIPLPWGTNVPKGWSIQAPSPNDPVIGNPSGKNFGFNAGHPFSLPIPDGFSIIDITHNNEAPGSGGHGYDAVALYNASSGVLIIADKGLDQNANGVPSVPDAKAVFSDGEYQAQQAVQFLEQSLNLVRSAHGGDPNHVLLTGHSLGGPLAIAQGLDLVVNHPHQSFEVVNFESIGSSKLVADATSGTFDPLGHGSHVTNADVATVAAHAVDFFAPHSVVQIGGYTGTPHIFGPELGEQVALENAQHNMETITPAVQAIVADHEQHEMHQEDLVAHQLANGAGHSWDLFV